MKIRRSKYGVVRSSARRVGGHLPSVEAVGEGSKGKYAVVRPVNISRLESDGNKVVFVSKPSQVEGCVG